jgi:hypothetical protein
MISGHRIGRKAEQRQADGVCLGGEFAVCPPRLGPAHQGQHHGLDSHLGVAVERDGAMAKYLLSPAQMEGLRALLARPRWDVSILLGQFEPAKGYPQARARATATENFCQVTEKQFGRNAAIQREGGKPP